MDLDRNEVYDKSGKFGDLFRGFLGSPWFRYPLILFFFIILISCILAASYSGHLYLDVINKGCAITDQEASQLADNRQVNCLGKNNLESVYKYNSSIIYYTHFTTILTLAVIIYFGVSYALYNMAQKRIAGPAKEVFLPLIATNYGITAGVLIKAAKLPPMSACGKDVEETVAKSSSTEIHLSKSLDRHISDLKNIISKFSRMEKNDSNAEDEQ